jgi:hypothetical protein
MTRKPVIATKASTISMTGTANAFVVSSETVCALSFAVVLLWTRDEAFVISSEA